MDQNSHISSNTPMSLSRITFVVLSLLCFGAGAFVGFLGVWQGFLFAAFWIPMFLIGVTGRPKVLFESTTADPNVPNSAFFESSGFRRHDGLAYLLLVAMVLAGLGYILLADLWPWLPHFAMGKAVLYLFFATACNAYLWQCRISPARLFWSYVLPVLTAGIMLAAEDDRKTLWAAGIFYTSAWGMFYSGLALHRGQADD